MGDRYIYIVAMQREREKFMKIDRLFAITNILIDKKTVTAAELAAEFGVSVRTIYRDMDILSTCGIPIFTEKGRNGGISIMEQYTLNKTLLTDEEQKQVIMALQSVNVTGNLEVNEALLKVRNVFQKNIKNWIEIDFASWGENEKEKEIFTVIRDSILYTKPVSFLYFSGKGEKSERIVEPLKVIFKGQSWYLYGYCRKRKDFRFFKLSRMSNLKSLSDTFDTEVPDKVSLEYKEPQEELVLLKLRINRSMGFRIFDEFKKAKITEEKETFLVEVYLPKSQWLFSYLLGYGDTLTILEPSEVKQEFVKKLNNIRTNYNMT